MDLSMFLSKSKRSGFTLIELLVVIAIIGTLASTVLVAVQDARMSARDTSIKRSVLELRNVVELYRNRSNTYAGIQSGGFWSNGIGPTEASRYECPSLGTLYPTLNADEIAKLIELCQSVVVLRAGKTVPMSGLEDEYILRINVATSTERVSKYSIMVMLASGNIFCLGSSGRSTETNIANWFIGSALNNQPGCIANP